MKPSRERFKAYDASGFATHLKLVVTKGIRRRSMRAEPQPKASTCLRGCFQACIEGGEAATAQRLRLVKCEIGAWEVDEAMADRPDTAWPRKNRCLQYPAAAEIAGESPVPAGTWTTSSSGPAELRDKPAIERSSTVRHRLRQDQPQVPFDAVLVDVLEDPSQ